MYHPDQAAKPFSASLARAQRCAQRLLALMLTFAAAAAAAQAQRAAAAPQADPLDARAPVPALRFDSALAGYKRLGDVPVASWRESNETVNRIGGWRVYAREPAQAEPAKAATPSPSAVPPSATPASAPSTPTAPAPPQGRHKH